MTYIGEYNFSLKYTNYMMIYCLKMFFLVQKMNFRFQQFCYKKTGLDENKAWSCTKLSYYSGQIRDL